MYKNQLQELAQRSCFNLPSYACMREGPDHAPRFRASVNFNGEIFESPGYSSTLRQAEHSAAEVALNALSTRGSKSLTARVLDETGVYKNLLQETAHKAGLDLPVYTTVRSGPGHVPVFTCTVELAGMDFTGEPAKTKKQAEKNAAIAAWSALKKMPNFVLKKETDNHEEQDKEIVRRVLSNLRPRTENQTVRRTVRRFHKDNRNSSASPVKYQSWRPLDYLFNSASSETQPQQQTSSCSSFVDLLPPPPPRTTSKILPLTFSSFPHKRHRNSPAQIATQSQVTMQEIPNYSKREDEERLDGSMKRAGKECTTTWSNTCKPFTMPSTSTSTTQQEHIKNKIFRPFRPPPPLATASKAAAFRGAPAVQIRSVIPVCSAPSPSMRTLKSNPPPLTLSPYHSSSMSTNTGGARVPPSSTNFNREEPDSTQLSSEFIKLQL